MAHSKWTWSLWKYSVILTDYYSFMLEYIVFRDHIWLIFFFFFFFFGGGDSSLISTKKNPIY